MQCIKGSPIDAGKAIIGIDCAQQGKSGPGPQYERGVGCRRLLLEHREWQALSAVEEAIVGVVDWARVGL